MTLPVPSLIERFHVEVELGPLEDHGMTRAGHRRVVPITGGTVTGALEGEILPGGADWQLVRADGAVEVDGRYTARTRDGALLYLQARGVRSGDPAVLEALLRGEHADPAAYYFRTVLTIETSAPELAWLEHRLFVCAAEREADAVRYTAYEVA
ncbi:DUF3237 domain-containing protein [Microbacterium sp. GXF7504]